MNTEDDQTKSQKSSKSKHSRVTAESSTTSVDGESVKYGSLPDKVGDVMAKKVPYKSTEEEGSAAQVTSASAPQESSANAGKESFVSNY